MEEFQNTKISHIHEIPTMHNRHNVCHLMLSFLETSFMRKTHIFNLDNKVKKKKQQEFQLTSWFQL